MLVVLVVTLDLVLLRTLLLMHALQTVRLNQKGRVFIGLLFLLFILAISRLSWALLLFFVKQASVHGRTAFSHFAGSSGEVFSRSEQLSYLANAFGCLVLEQLQVFVAYFSSDVLTRCSKRFVSHCLRLCVALSPRHDTAP